jgi:hypothetical protein
VLMGGGIPTIATPFRLDLDEVSRVGPDIKVVARVHRDR